MSNNMDYKYIIQDTMNIFIGAKFTVKELEEDDRIPVKLISSLRKVIILEEDEDIAIDVHLYQLSKQDKAYRMWKQLRISMKFQNLQPTLVRGKEIFESEVVTFQEGMEKMEKDPFGEKWFLSEIKFAKMRLAMLGIN